MRLAEARTEESDGASRVVGVMEEAGGRLPDVWFEVGARWRDFLRADADVFVPIMLVASMRAGEPLETDLPVSERMAAELPRIQDVFTAWFAEEMRALPPRLSNVVAKPPSAGDGTAVFFSGGVDAWHALRSDRLRPRGPSATHLLYVSGVEAPLSRISRGKAQRLRDVSGKLGLPLVEMATNLRDCFQWEYQPYVCGPALVGSALALSNGFSRVLMPIHAGYRQEDLYPSSSHLLLDELWSTEYLTVTLRGAELPRARKIASVTEDPFVLANLSVCTTRNGEWGNCCRCPKCLATMASLQALGRLEDTSTFQGRFPYELIREINLDLPWDRSFLKQNLELAGSTGRDPRLARELSRHLRRWERHRALVALLKDTPLHRPASLLQQLLKRLLRRKRRAVPGTPTFEKGLASGEGPRLGTDPPAREDPPGGEREPV